jgi:AraC family transcriptional regulator, glycine betaine-responsive activator
MSKSEQASIFAPDPQPLSVTFLVFRGCSIMCVASAVDQLRAANRIVGRTAFDWQVVSSDGEAPATTSGLRIDVAGRFDPAQRSDVLVAIGGFGTRYETAGPLVGGFLRAARSARAVGGIEAEDLEDFAAAFPGTDVRPDRYVIDGPVFTAGGASPAFDLMLHLVRARLGTAVALDVASVFIYDQARAPADAQPLVSLGRLDGHDPRLAKAIALMEGHVDQPLPISAIARRCGVTARTLEKVFAGAIGQTPGAFYLRLRLNAARRLVLDTSEPMADVAARTGFSSASAFSRAFSRAFRTPPAAMRRR